jgi:hypothetical protein
MVKKLLKLFLFFVCACFVQAQQKPATQAAQAEKPASEDKPAQAQKPALSWCRLGTDPVDASRQPDWGAECVVKSPAMPVTMMTGSGRQVRCLIPPLTPVVVDRETGVAKWVLQCGNPILQPANWVPQGTRICGPEQPSQTAAPAPATPQASSVPAEMRVSGEVRVVHEGEVRLVHSGEIRHVHEPQPALVPVQAPAPTPQPKKGWWSRNWKWVVPIAIGAGTGAAVVLNRGGQKTIHYQPLPPPLYRP